MHQPIKDNLEDYLRGVGGKFTRPVPPEMKAHLDSCGECAEKLTQLERQSVALRSLRAPDDVEPRAGFYARVMQRIEDARATNSVGRVTLRMGASESLSRSINNSQATCPIR